MIGINKDKVSKNNSLKEKLEIIKDIINRNKVKKFSDSFINFPFVLLENLKEPNHFKFIINENKNNINIFTTKPLKMYGDMNILTDRILK